MHWRYQYVRSINRDLLPAHASGSNSWCKQALYRTVTACGPATQRRNSASVRRLGLTGQQSAWIFLMVGWRQSSLEANQIKSDDGGSPASVKSPTVLRNQCGGAEVCLLASGRMLGSFGTLRSRLDHLIQSCQCLQVLHPPKRQRQRQRHPPLPNSMRQSN